MGIPQSNLCFPQIHRSRQALTAVLAASARCSTWRLPRSHSGQKRHDPHVGVHSSQITVR
jgi:hypothetical protein